MGLHDALLPAGWAQTMTATTAAQTAQLEQEQGTQSGKRKEKLKTVFIILVPSNVIHSCPAKTLTIKGKQEKKGSPAHCLDTWEHNR